VNANDMLRSTLLLAMAAMIGLSDDGCAKKKASETAAGPTELDAVVIKNYEGKKVLSLCVTGDHEGRTAEQIDADQYVLKVTGLVASGQTFTFRELMRHQPYRKAMTVESKDGWTENIVCDGVLVSDLIGKAGPLPGAVGVTFRSQDGYEVSFPLNYILENKILLVHRVDGKPLSAEGGFPFMLASESYQGQKWMKWVTEIDLK
jgi:DMSO/TMAO reductase YedYZ molybdopterin-dependent catalytic subunit